MFDCATVNASPLIYLSKSRLLNLLEVAAGRLVIPRMVLNELSVKEAVDGCLQRVLNMPTIQIVEHIDIPPVIQEWDLGPGESSVLAYAYGNSGTVAVLDDLAARRCAESLGLPLLGTLGLVLRARKSGIIPSAFSAISQLKSNGMYLSDRVINQVLELVDERIE